jgi:PTS system nitrogen regulatory IIA component
MRCLLDPEAVMSRFEASNKQQILRDMAAKAGAILGVDPVSIFDVLWEREKLGTTGVGNGIAIPHGRVPGLGKVGAFFARLETPVDFQSVDDKPVDLVFLILAPSEAGADHLHALATVSKLLRSTGLCEALRAAKGQEELYRLLTETPIAEAA